MKLVIHSYLLGVLTLTSCNREADHDLKGQWNEHEAAAIRIASQGRPVDHWRVTSDGANAEVVVNVSESPESWIVSWDIIYKEPTLGPDFVRRVHVSKSSGEITAILSGS